MGCYPDTDGNAEEPMGTYETIEDGGWTELPPEGVYLACCSCSLVHLFKPTRRGGKLGLLVRRDERKTAALRRNAGGTAKTTAKGRKRGNRAIKRAILAG